MSNLPIPASYSPTWLKAETQAHLQEVLSPLSDAQTGSPVALLMYANSSGPVRLDPITQVVLAGPISDQSSSSHTPFRIMDLEDPLRARVSLAATALHTDDHLWRITRRATGILKPDGGGLDIYITRHAILAINSTGQWEKALKRDSLFAEAALATCALCLIPQPQSAHQSIEMVHLVKGLGALAEMDIELVQARDGARSRILDPDLRNITQN